MELIYVELIYASRKSGSIRLSPHRIDGPLISSIPFRALIKGEHAPVGIQ